MKPFKNAPKTPLRIIKQGKNTEIAASVIIENYLEIPIADILVTAANF